jgi:hypothetical protein
VITGQPVTIATVFADERLTIGQVEHSVGVEGTGNRVVGGVGPSLGAGERCHVLLDAGGLGLVAAELVQDVLEGVERLGAGIGEQLEGAVRDDDRVRVPGGGDRRVALPGQGGGDRVRYRGGGPAGQAG